MGAPIPLSVMRQQPQQGVQIDRSSRISAGALAIVTPTIDINWATGKQLARGGSGYALTALGGYQTLNFNKNFYLETETLPAVGTKPYVMFWLGWPVATGAVLGPSEPAFVVGSSNNTLGICISVGSARAIGNGPAAAATWGGSNNTWTSIWSSYDTLAMGTSGAPVLLMMVRKSTGLEFWRNGVLVNTVAGSPTNVAAFKLEIGSFIGSTNWTTSSNTVLAGLSVLASDPTAAELQAFSANPWGLFKAQSNLPLITALTASGSSGAPAGAILVPSSTAEANGAGSLNTGIALSPQGAQAAAGLASIQAAVSLSATGTVTALGSVSLSTKPAGLGAFGVTDCAADAALTASISMSTTAAAKVSGAVSLSAAGTWAVQSVCSASAGASLTVACEIATAAITKASGTASLTGGAAQQGDIDVSRISPARTVVFEGSGSRVVLFEGTGSRVVTFEGSGSRIVVFEGSGSKTVRFE